MPNTDKMYKEYKHTKYCKCYYCKKIYEHNKMIDEKNTYDENIIIDTSKEKIDLEST